MPQVRARIAMGELTPTARGTSTTTRETTFLFSDAEVVRLKAMGLESRRETFRDDGRSEFTVAQIAAMWQLSTDPIQRLFQNESGFITLGNKNPRGKHSSVAPSAAPIGPATNLCPLVPGHRHVTSNCHFARAASTGRQRVIGLRPLQSHCRDQCGQSFVTLSDYQRIRRTVCGTTLTVFVQDA